jgi:hypothetical protein
LGTVVVVVVVGAGGGAVVGFDEAWVRRWSRCVVDPEVWSASSADAVVDAVAVAVAVVGAGAVVGFAGAEAAYTCLVGGSSRAETPSWGQRHTQSWVPEEGTSIGHVHGLVREKTGYETAAAWTTMITPAWYPRLKPPSTLRGMEHTSSVQRAVSLEPLA